jgi:hypothetical protein
MLRIVRRAVSGDDQWIAITEMRAKKSNNCYFDLDDVVISWFCRVLLRDTSSYFIIAGIHETTPRDLHVSLTCATTQ